MERLNIPESLQRSFGSKCFIEHKINTHLYNTLQRVKTKDLVSLRITSVPGCCVSRTSGFL